jgi:hypothetical protein
MPGFQAQVVGRLLIISSNGIQASLATVVRAVILALNLDVLRLDYGLLKERLAFSENL